MTNDTKIWTATARHKSAKHALDADMSEPATAPSPPPPAPAPKPPKKRKQRGALRTLLRALGWGFAGVIGLLLAGGLYITGPLGERSLTALTMGLTNKALAPSGLRMELVGITGLWDGEVRVMGLKLFDQKGEWLDLAEGVLYPLWGSVMRNSLDSARALQKLHLADDPTAQGDILLDLRRITLFDLTFVRPPELIADATPTPSIRPEPLRILPSWLELDVGELEVVRFAFGPANDRIYSNIYASARLSDAQGELRLGAFLSPSKRLLQGAPLPEALPGDVTLSRKELAAADALPEKDSASALADAFAALSGNKNKDASKDNRPTADSGSNYGGDNGNAVNTPHIKSPDEGMAPLPPSTATGVNNAASPPVPGQEGQQPGQSAPKPQAAGTAQVVFNVVWDGTFADARWQARDTMLLTKIFPGIERLWSRARVQCNLTQWPPSPEYPLQIRLVSRFGLTVKDLKERVRASLCAGQFFWDGQTLVARDLDLRLPLHDPHVTLQGSGGLSRASGPGVRLRLEVGSLSNLVKALGMTHLEQDLGGSVQGHFAVGRGGRHTLWWTRPLPEPLGFAKNPLPGFTAAPMAPELAQLEAKGLLHDSVATDNHGSSHADSQRDSSRDSIKNATATATAQRPVTLAVHDPRASLAPTALHTRITLQSDKLKLPGGEVDGFSLVLRGTSLDADSAPEGTMRRKENANKVHNGEKKTQTRAKAGAPLPSSAAPAAPAAPAGKDSDSDDFAASGLPRGMVGALELKASSIFALGDANLRSQWMVGGLHGDADVLLIELSHLVGKLPGSTLGGDVEMSYALPIRRPWPWLDGKLDVAVENWQALKRIIKSPVQGDGMGLSLRMESRFNEKNEPRQYLRAEVKARQVDAPTFSVNEVRGDVESDHAHALADLFSLAFTPSWKRKASPEGPPPLDYDLLKARLQLGAGSGGPVQWNSGLCTLTVAGEDARIDANLKGNVRGLLEGVFNFRTRLLQIRKLEVSQGPENDEKGLRLRTPLVAALHENGGMKPVELTLRYGKGIEASARLFAQLQPLHAKTGIPQPRSAKTAPRSAKGAASTAAGEGGDAEADPANAGKADFNKNAGNAGNGGFGAPETVAEGAEFVPVNRLLMGEARVWGLPGQNAPGADSPSALTARVQLPLRFAPLPAVLEDAPLGAEIRWQGELEPLWRLLPLPGRSLSGTAAISAGVGGTLAKPQVQGAATLRQARYVDKLEGLSLQDITLDMEYGGKDLSRFMLSAADGRGGSMLLRGALLQEGTALLLNAAGSLTRLRPLHRDDLSLSLSGELALRGPLLGVMPEALRAAPPQVLPRGKATDVGQLPQKTAKAAGAGEAAGTTADAGKTAETAVDATDTVKPEAEQKAQATQAGIETLLSAPMPPHLLLSGRLRLDEGVFQLLQGFAPSVASLEGVEKGTKPPALTREWLASLGLHTGLGGAAASAAVTQAVITADTATGTPGDTLTRERAKGDTKAENTSNAKKNKQNSKKRNSAGKAATGAVASTESATPEATAGMTVMPLLQLTIDAPGRFFIRGKGLDSEWRAALRVEGSAKAPRLLGSFSPVRGTFELLNRQFRFDGGGIHFNGTWPPNPSLDIALAYKSAQITALVQVLGSARRPRLDLTSQPPLPRDEVMAQVLFGKNMESLSRLETLQAANAARQLVDMGPSALDVMSSARDALGLQVLRLGSGSAAGTKSAPRDASVRGQSGEGQDLGTTLEAGKYITDSVYVGVEQGTKPEAGTAVRVEVELTPNMSLSGRTSQESSGVGLNWKMDY